MQGAASGVYCGPLRLLAMEVYDTCNAAGVYCNLITGQASAGECVKRMHQKRGHKHLGVVFHALENSRTFLFPSAQERREVQGALHTSCTVEMVNMQRRVDVAVLDEIQMIGDEGR